MVKIGRILTTVLAIVAGLFVLTDLFVSQWPGDLLGVPGLKQAIGGISSLFVGWVAIVVAFALFLGFFNVFSVHVNKIRTRSAGAIYSVVLVAALLITLFVGFSANGPNSTGSRFIFDYVLQPLEATLF